MTHLVFTDLDGTLLDHKTYSWEGARQAIEELRRRGIAWIPVTSKTRAEVEVLRELWDHKHPFIVENGAAAYVPNGYFPFPIEGAESREGYQVKEWGTPYRVLRHHLKAAAEAAACRVIGFGDMTGEEVSAATGLPLAQAQLAKQREYDEPFLIPDEKQASALQAEVGRRGMEWTRGGRFWHISGRADKGRAVTHMTSWFERVHGPLVTIGLGDNFNDVSFLRVVRRPVLLRTPVADQVRRAIPGATVTEQEGPSGWGEAVLRLIDPTSS